MNALRALSVQDEAHVSASVNTFIPGVNILFPSSLDFDRMSHHEHLGAYCTYLTNLTPRLSVW